MRNQTRIRQNDRHVVDETIALSPPFQYNYGGKNGSIKKAPLDRFSGRNLRFSAFEPGKRPAVAFIPSPESSCGMPFRPNSVR
jgi:hypothetical protein